MTRYTDMTNVTFPCVVTAVSPPRTMMEGRTRGGGDHSHDDTDTFIVKTAPQLIIALDQVGECTVGVCDAYMRCFCCRHTHSPPVEVTHICDADKVIGRPYHVEESFHGLLKTEATVYGSAYKGNEWSMGRCAMI